MEFASIQTQNQEIPSKFQNDSTIRVNPPKNPERKRKPKPPKDTSALNQRRDRRRRRTSSDADDFNVNFSKIKISESSRVLRSRAKRSHSSSSLENICEIPNCSQSDAVAKDHSYSKASKRLIKQKEPVKNTPTVHLKVLIDRTSSEENTFDRHKELCTDVDPAPIAQNIYRRSNKIEIIDFDDLELSNSCYADHGTKCDHNFNDLAMENRNMGNPSDQPPFNKVPDEDQLSVENNVPRDSYNERVYERPIDQQDQCELIAADDSDLNLTAKTDFEKLWAKYCDADHYLTKSTPFLDQSHWMLESDIDATNLMERSKITNEDTSASPVYLDLDQNRKAVSSPQKVTTITQQGAGGIFSIASPMNFPSGGCFQKLGTVVTSTVTRPEPEYCNGSTSNCVPFAPTDVQETMWHQGPPAHTSFAIGRCPPNGFPNYQTFFEHKIDSLIMSKPQEHTSNGRTNVNNFSTSGGSIERIISPVIPKQPSTLKKYPGISVPFSDTVRLASESTQFDIQNGQQPECRIHLVETPPSFTRTSQPEISQIITRTQSNGGQNSSKSQLSRTEASLNGLNGCQIRTPSKPKRTRRTRAQMEIYRQEMARTCNHRSKRNQRFASRTSRHIVGRNFSMEYRRVHSHPQEYFYSGLPTRTPHYMRPQQHRYSETYSVNETNLFGVSSNSDEWPQTFDHFSNFSHGLAEFRSFQPLWSLNRGMKNLNAFTSTEAGDPYQKYQEPPMENLQSPSSVMWNQQVRSIQLQSSYGNVQQVPVTNSRFLSDARRPFTPWHQPLGASLEQLSSNLSDVSISDPMQYY